MRIRFPIATIAWIAACSSADRPSTGQAGTVRDSVTRCGLTIPHSLPADSIAVRCAERFIARNGYTDLAVEDTSAISHESIEVGTTPKEVLEHRRGSLARHGVVLCHDRRDASGFTVGFVAPGDTSMKVGRAVTMDSTWGQIRMEHQDFLPSAAAAMPGCARLVAHVTAR
jgi:hypothetical protein